MGENGIKGSSIKTHWCEYSFSFTNLDYLRREPESIYVVHFIIMKYFVQNWKHPKYEWEGGGFMREGSRHCRLKLKHFLPFRMSAHCDVGDVFHQVACAILNDVATATCHAKGKTSPSCPNITLQKRMTWAPSLGAAFVFLVVCFISICLYILRRVDDISYYIIVSWKRYQDVNMCKTAKHSPSHGSERCQ